MVKQEDHAKPSVMTILNSVDPKQNAQVDNTSKTTNISSKPLNVEESSQDRR